MKTIVVILTLLSFNALAAPHCQDNMPLSDGLTVLQCDRLLRSKGEINARSAEACVFILEQVPMALAYIINQQEVNRFYISQENLTRDQNTVPGSWSATLDYPNFISRDTFEFVYHAEDKRLRIRQNPDHFPAQSTVDITLLCR